MTARGLLGLWCLSGLLLSPAPFAAPDWSALRARLEQGDTDLDFRSLRLAFADSPQYRPDAAEIATRQARVQQALAEGEYAQALAAARDWLAVDYLNAFAHLGAARGHEAGGNPSAAAFHREVAGKLLDSLCLAGEGRSPELPCVAIALSEIYAYLASRHLEPGARYEAECARGLACVVFEVREGDTGNLLDLYFDISRPLAFQSAARHGAGD